MKRYLSSLIASVILMGAMGIGTLEAANTYVPKSTHKYISGPKGGCYYWNKNSKKTYVSRYLCNK